MGGGHKHGQSSDKGLFSDLASFAAGAGHYPLAGSYPPQGYPHQGYPSQGYPNHGYPPQGYPPAGYPPPNYGGYPPAGYPPPSHGYPPAGYPGHNGPGGLGALLAGGTAAAGAAYGAHQLSHGHQGSFYGYGHGHGKFKHGNFGKHGHGFYGKHKGFGHWK